MTNELIVFEVEGFDRDVLHTALIECDCDVLDEIEIKRLDGIDSIQLIVDISKVAIPAAVGLIIGILQNRKVVIKKGGVEYRGPFDRELIERILKK